MLLRLTKDWSRTNWCSLAVLIVVLVLMTPSFLQLQAQESITRDELRAFIIPLYLLFWVLSCAVYVVVTHLVFTRPPMAELREKILADTQPARPLQRFVGINSAVSFALQATLVSLIITVAISRTTAFDHSALIMTLTLLSVVGSWVLTAQTFAVENYREWIRGEAITLQGIDEPEYEDFWHSSLLTSTLLSVNTTYDDRKGRRRLSWQAVVALLFNTVILAMAVAFLMR